MSSEESTAASVSAALTKLVGEVYADVARPSARQVGAALETLFKVGLSPIKLLDWGFEQSKDWLVDRVHARMAATPVEARIAPPYAIVVHTVTGIASAHDSEEMRELYAELLLKAMDARTSASVHPAYLSILGQLSPAEALVLLSVQRLAEARAERRDGDAVFVERRGAIAGPIANSLEHQFERHCATLGLSDPAMAQVWLDNLQRLALLKVDSHADLNLVHSRRERTRLVEAEYRYLLVTELGAAFIRACRPPNAADAV